MFGKKSKKQDARDRDETIKGAQKVENEKKKSVDHQHVLMMPKYKLSLLEISHRTIEEIEKARFRIMAQHKGQKAVEEFKNYIFNKLIAE